ncbi:MAG TPA: TlpA disulfide reductase family protein [Verrucomicrobiae bacterium]|jgi:peroxiredoxin|nr:TlpA disulfide reductase family protein [Verrucomicrobiae bacterium]
MRRLASIVVLLALAARGLASPPSVVPRPSPQFSIYEPSGKTTLLSSFKGKVVVIEFLFIKSPHCMRVAQTMNKLQKDLGPRGLQSIAIAFPAPGSDADGPLVTYMVDSFKLTYPVGYTTADNVDKYLGRGRNDVLNIPQVVVIDRAGMIRAQSGGRPGDPKLENEDSLRSLLDSLLNEKPQRGAAKTAPAGTRKSH